jgi:hypothetical protein
MRAADQSADRSADTGGGIARAPDAPPRSAASDTPEDLAITLADDGKPAAAGDDYEPL